MTSTQSKFTRLKQGQLLRAKALAGIDTTDPSVTPPPGAALADQKELAHNNTYGRLPSFYVDKVVVCRQCGKEEVWPAERQKWWYEVAKGNINTTAVLCRACREKEKQKKNAARRVHFEGLKKKLSGCET
ncbi:MAG: zinc-ribbon domain-containing protein [Desulfuromonadales bacterium]|nr:zinc-ribbon domain-containing protein [Desulfuromonadales bacterium]